MEMQRTIRDYHKQLYADKIGNLEQVNKFLQRYNLAKLNQEEMENIEQTNYKYWNWICDLKNSQDTELQEY